MRTRRDHARFLNLIEVSAFLHQHQRERREAGAIVAAVADYAVAYALAGEVLAETLSDLKKPLPRGARSASATSAAEGDGSRLPPRDPRGPGVPDSTVRRLARPSSSSSSTWQSSRRSQGGAGKIDALPRWSSAAPRVTSSSAC